MHIDELLDCARYGEIDDLIGATNLYESGTGGNTALHFASANGHLDIVKYIVERDPSVVNVVNDLGNTPLHWAALNGHVDIIEILMTNGANPMLKNSSGFTALFNAQQNDKEDAVVALLRLANLDEESEESEADEEMNDVEPEIEIEYVTESGNSLEKTFEKTLNINEVKEKI